MTARIRSRMAAGLVVGTIAGLFLSGAAQAITDTFFRYSEPKKASYTIHPAALAPHSFGAVYNNISGSLTSASTICYQTGVNLPQGAKITALRVWYESNNANNLRFELGFTELSSGAAGALVNEVSTDSSGNRVAESFTVSGEFATVNNNTDMYDFRVCFVSAAAQSFNGARLTYTYTNAGD